MPLYWFLLVVSALASDSMPVREVPAGRALIASFGALAGWALLSHIAARTAARQVLQEQDSFSTTALLLGKQMDLLRWLGLALAALVLAGFGLAGLINKLPWGSDSIVLRALLLLTPGLFVTVWSWSCELRFDRAIYAAPANTTMFSHLLAMFRLQAAWLLAPIFALLCIIDATHLLFDIPPTQGALVSGATALIALPFMLPTILHRIWKLSELPDPQQVDWTQRLIAATGTRGIHVLMWNTDHTFCTAMVAGFVPGFRRLLLSDALVARLTPQQTSMVILHELAHIRRFHLPLRLLVLLPVWAIASMLTHLLGDFQYADIAGIIIGLTCSVLALRWVAYRTEFDADAVAVRLAVAMHGTVESVPRTAALASAALADALMTVTADQPAARNATWMHPSIHDRCRTLLEPHSLLDHTAVPLVLAPHAPKS